MPEFLKSVFRTLGLVAITAMAAANLAIANISPGGLGQQTDTNTTEASGDHGVANGLLPEVLGTGFRLPGGVAPSLIIDPWIVP